MLTTNENKLATLHDLGVVKNKLQKEIDESSGGGSGGGQEESQFADIPIYYSKTTNNKERHNLQFSSIYVDGNQSDVLEKQTGYVFTDDFIEDSYNIKKIEFISGTYCRVYGVAYAEPADGGPGSMAITIDILCHRSKMNTESVNNIMYYVRIYY